MEKISELVWKVLYLPSFSPRISIYSDSYNIFDAAKISKILMISKIPPKDISLKNLLTFTGSGLKICSLEGKRLLITRVIILNTTVKVQLIFIYLFILDFLVYFINSLKKLSLQFL